jgi:hypothetical protein
MLALRAVIDAKPDVFNHTVETIPRLVFARAPTGHRASVRMGSFRAFAGRTLSFSPSRKTTNEELANRQQRKTLPARFSVFVLLINQSH